MIVLKTESIFSGSYSNAKIKISKLQTEIPEDHWSCIAHLRIC